MLVATGQLNAQPNRREQARVTGIQRRQWGAFGARIGSRRLAFARDPDPTRIPDELQTVRMLVRDAHLDASRIGQLDLVGAMNIPDPVARELGLRLDAAGATELGVQRPVHGVVVVGPRARDHPQAIGLVAHPPGPAVTMLRRYPLLGVVDLGRTPEP